MRNLWTAPYAKCPWQDTLYFDMVLRALHSDQVTQGQCVLRATQLGQAAAEDVARLADEARVVEIELRQGIQERAAAVKQLRTVVDHNRRISKSHVRSEVRGRGLATGCSPTHFVEKISKQCRDDVDVPEMSISPPQFCRNRRNSGAAIDISRTSTSSRHLSDESFLYYWALGVLS